MSVFRAFRVGVVVREFEEQRASLGALKYISPVNPRFLELLLRLLPPRVVYFSFITLRVFQTSFERFRVPPDARVGLFFDNSFHSKRKFRDLASIFSEDFVKASLYKGIPRISLVFRSVVFSRRLSRAHSRDFNDLLVCMQVTTAITYYFIFRKARKDLKDLSFVALANDHSPAPVALASIATSCGIKTICLQHAPVSSIFPRCRMSYFVIDNLETLSIYKQKATNTKFFVHTLNYVDKKKSFFRGDVVAVAFNELIDLAVVQKVCKSLASQFVEVEVKFHPSTDPNQQVRFMKSIPGNCKVVPSTEKISARSVICTLSGVVVELCMMGHKVSLLDTGESFDMDYYGFLSVGNVDLVNLQDINSFEIRTRAHRESSARSFNPRYDLQGVTTVHELSNF